MVFRLGASSRQSQANSGFCKAMRMALAPCCALVIAQPRRAWPAPGRRVGALPATPLLYTATDPRVKEKVG